MTSNAHLFSRQRALKNPGPALHRPVAPPHHLTPPRSLRHPNPFGRYLVLTHYGPLAHYSPTAPPRSLRHYSPLAIYRAFTLYRSTEPRVIVCGKLRLIPGIGRLCARVCGQGSGTPPLGSIR